MKGLMAAILLAASLFQMPAQVQAETTMEELDELMKMTVTLAQLSSRATLQNGRVPWYSLLEAE